MSNARKLADNLPTEGQLSGRNAITNGGMTVDQRNSGSATTPTADRTYTLDRWMARLNNASKYSVQQVTDAPSGYYNSLKVTSAAATTVGSTDYYQINTIVEGYNLTAFDFGLSTAKKLTLSFWVKSSLTGTFAGSYSNNAGNRFYAWTYTISSANTWEHKTITVDGVTDGSWERTNGSGLWVYWTLGAGSGMTATAGSWGTTFKRGVTGAINVVETNGATLQITGVQLEVGSQASSFEHEPYSVSLAKAQRYYQLSHTNGQGYVNANQHVGVRGTYRTEMRVAPTVTLTLNSSNENNMSGSPAVHINGTHGYYGYFTANNAGNYYYYYNGVSDAEL